MVLPAHLEDLIGKPFELFADRASSHTPKANRLRVQSSVMACTLVAHSASFGILTTT
jgi:hypothetical protein